MTDVESEFPVGAVDGELIPTTGNRRGRHQRVRCIGRTSSRARAMYQLVGVAFPRQLRIR